MSETVRADKWLWAIRAFKTRSEAAKSCQAGRVKREGHKVKPSTVLKVGDRIELPAREASYTRTLELVKPIDMRVGAPEAATCYVDHTDEKLREEARERAKEDRKYRKEGSQGRMTKRERRVWEQSKGGFFE